MTRQHVWIGALLAGLACGALSLSPLFAILAGGPRSTEIALRVGHPAGFHASAVTTRSFECPPIRGVLGVTAVHSEDDLRDFACKLGRAFDQPTSQILERLRRLRARPGAGVYLQIEHQEPPFRITVVPTEGEKAALVADLGTLSGLPSGRALNKSIVVFWIKDGTEREYKVKVPKSITHLSIVANGRGIVLAHPIDHKGGPTSFVVR